MARATIALGLMTTLDVATARRLYDYGELDDNGVAAALEHTGLQRSNGGNRPDHLTRIHRAAAVIDSDDDITLAAFEATNIDEECAVLSTLFALFPDGPGRAVSWAGGAWELLLRRAYMHELQAPPAVRDWPRQPLCRLFDEQAPSPGYDVRADAVGLYGNHAAALDDIDPALRLAVHWHDMDLRWRLVAGEIDREARQQRSARVMAQIAGDSEAATGEGRA